MSLLFSFVQVHVQQNREPLKCSVERFSRLYKKSISYGFLNWTLFHHKKSWGQHWEKKQFCQKIFKIYNYDNVSITLNKRVKIFILKSFQNNQLSPWYNIFVTSKSYRPCLPNVNRLGILPNITSFLINGIFAHYIIQNILF